MGNRKRRKTQGIELRLQSILHDLASPLSVVQLNLDMLQDNFAGKNNPELDKFIDRALLGIKQANRIVINTKQVVKNIPKRTPFSAVEQVEELANLYSVKFKYHQINLEKDYRDDKMLLADLSAFQRIMTNLIDNAIDAVMVNNAQRYLRIKTGRTTREFTISVTDNGQGINQELLHLIFNPGFSSKGTNRGMGLFIVKELMQSNFNGKVEYIKGFPGSTFRLIFPYS